MLDKIAIEGRQFKLTRESIKSVKDIDKWVNGFIGSFDSADRSVIKSHKFLWRKMMKIKRKRQNMVFVLI